MQFFYPNNQCIAEPIGFFCSRRSMLTEIPYIVLQCEDSSIANCNAIRSSLYLAPSIVEAVSETKKRGNGKSEIGNLETKNIETDSFEDDFLKSEISKTINNKNGTLLKRIMRRTFSKRNNVKQTTLKQETSVTKKPEAKQKKQANIGEKQVWNNKCNNKIQTTNARYQKQTLTSNKKLNYKEIRKTSFWIEPQPHLAR